MSIIPCLAHISLYSKVYFAMDNGNACGNLRSKRYVFEIVHQFPS